MNKKNHNVLDAALNAEMKNVAFAIASHERFVEKATRKKKTKKRRLFF